MRKIIRRENPFGLIDPFFDDFFLGKKNLFDSQILKTDIKEEQDHYLVKIDVPEIKKEDIKLSLENGNLTISATLNKENESEESGRYIRRERQFGSCSRSFYVGDDVMEEDVKAKLEDGVLTLTIVKKEPKQNTNKFIDIE